MSLELPCRIAFGCALTLLPLGSCACPDAYNNRASACVEIEEGADESGLFGNGVDVPTLTGLKVNDDDFVSADLFGCDRDEGRHSVTVANDAGRARFSWGHEADAIHDALDVAIAEGEVTVEQITPSSFEGGSAFVVRDANGLAIAIEHAHGLREVDDVTVDHGFPRGSTPTMCGLAWVTGVRVETPDASHDVWVGTDVAVTASGQAMRFHAFHGSRYAPWVCTDTQDTVSWALVREDE